MEQLEKDTYTYLVYSNPVIGVNIFKNNKLYTNARTKEEAKELIKFFENFDSLKLSASATNLVLYLGGRQIGEIKVPQNMSKLIVDKMIERYNKE